MAGVVTNIDKVLGLFTRPPSVPKIHVHLRNTDSKAVAVAPRDEIVLWFPGIDGHYTVGKYEFLEPGTSTPHSAPIEVSPGTDMVMRARVLNEPLLAGFLSRGDLDFSLVVHRVGGSSTLSDPAPFTRDTLDRVFVAVDVAAKR